VAGAVAAMQLVVVTVIAPWRWHRACCGPLTMKSNQYG
jgi:hypothetical protein